MRDLACWEGLRDSVKLLQWSVVASTNACHRRCSPQGFTMARSGIAESAAWAVAKEGGREYSRRRRLRPAFARIAWRPFSELCRRQCNLQCRTRSEQPVAQKLWGKRLRRIRASVCHEKSHEKRMSFSAHFPSSWPVEAASDHIVSTTTASPV